MASAFEHIVKASFLNVTKDAPNLAGPLLMLQASTYSRIGNDIFFGLCFKTYSGFAKNRVTLKGSHIWRGPIAKSFENAMQNKLHMKTT